MDPGITDAKRAAILSENGGQAVSFECRQICVEFQLAQSTRQVLNDIDFDVYDGEFLAILGASGSGKTTLLRSLGRLTRYRGWLAC